MNPSSIMNLWAVHIADGLLNTPWTVGGWGVMLLMVAWASRNVEPELIPRIGLFTAALFLATQIHLPLGVTSVHLLMNAIAGILLGKRVWIAMCVAVGLQAFLFAHGGLRTLGVNVCIMGLPAMLALSIDFSKLNARGRAIWASALGATVAALTVTLNALVLWFGLPAEAPLAVGVIFLAHLPVIVVEGILTGVIVQAIAIRKPEWLGPTPRVGDVAANQLSGVISENGTSH